LLDGSGNALAAWENARIGAGGLASNYFSRSDGGWFFQLAPDEFGSLGGVPGSFNSSGSDENVQLVATTGGDFLLAWQTFDDPLTSAEVRIARFTSRTHTWSEAQTLLPRSGQNIQLQRIGSDAGATCSCCGPRATDAYGAQGDSPGPRRQFL